MSTPRRIDRLPPNFDEFVDEVARGLHKLYGIAAERQYRETAAKSVHAALKHPATYALAVFDGARATGMLLAALRGGVGEISYTHVLRGHRHTGIEERLIAESVGAFRAGGVDGILSECITFCPLDEEPAYAALGFATVERAIMGASLDEPRLRADPPRRSRPLEMLEAPEAAAIIVDAYRGHPGRDLHTEVRTPAAALAFINSVLAGGYGPVREDYVRIMETGGLPAAAAVGCQVAPDVGFVLQIAVSPPFQSHGLGTRLLRELAGTFSDAGLHRIALGVTWDNPARVLYEGLGFTPLRRLNAYIWWRP